MPSYSATGSPRLLRRPRPLITFVGLYGENELPDPQGERLSDVVWRSFTTNRDSSRSALSFQQVPFNHVFPKRKPRADYQTYRPPGIIKSDWMYKHLNVIPAVAVVFFELEWDEGNWQERQSACAKTIKDLRQSLQSRETRLVVILLQKSLKPKDETQTEQRAISFRRACEVEGKNSLFVLPLESRQFQDLRMYILRLESVFSELAHGYYEDSMRRVRSHRVEPSVSNHILTTRHQFKMGFFAELAGLSADALKHYNLAYTALFSINAPHIKPFEIKTVAGLVNYRACRIQLSTSLYKALEFFRKHMANFKPPQNDPAELVRHWSWAMRQNQVFAEAFEEAVETEVVKMDASHHPGVFYVQAAECARRRHKAYIQIAGSGEPAKGLLRMESINRDGSEIKQAEYVGQPYLLESAQAEEVDHVVHVIELLTLARKQYKQLKSTRMARFLAVQIADEYRDACQYERALLVYTKVVEDYRAERWSELVDGILQSALHCAVQMGQVHATMHHAFELAADSAALTLDERLGAQAILAAVLKFQAPIVPGTASPSGHSIWTDQVVAEVVQVYMTHVLPGVTCLVGFREHTYISGQPVVLDVMVRSHMAAPIRFSAIHVHFSDPTYDTMCVVADPNAHLDPVITAVGGSSQHDFACWEADVHTTDLSFSHLHTKVFSFTLPSHAQPNKILEVRQVRIVLGAAGRALHLDFPRPRPAVPTYADRILAGLDDASLVDAPDQQWYTHVVPRTSSLGIRAVPAGEACDDGVHIVLTAVDGASAATTEGYVSASGCHSTDVATVVLTGERYPLVLEITSRERQTMSDLVLHAEITSDNPGREAGLLGTTTERSPLETSLLSGIAVCSTLDPLAKVRVTVFIDGINQDTPRIFICRLTYKLDGQLGECEVPLPLLVSHPLSCNVEVVAQDFTNVEDMQGAFAIRTPIIMATDIVCTAPVPIKIMSTEIQLEKPMMAIGGNLRQESIDVLYPGRTVSDVVVVEAMDVVEEVAAMGTMVVTWSRVGDVSGKHSLSIELPRVKVQKRPITVTAHMAPYGTISAVYRVQYIIRNHSGRVEQVMVVLETSDAFMFSGNKAMRLTLPPLNTHVLTYNVFPLACGRLPLPRLSVRSLREDVDVSTDACPVYAFIKPAL